MKKGKLLSQVCLLAAASLALTACNHQKASQNTHIKFKDEVPIKPIKKGGTLSYALETDSPFTGIFLPEIADTSIDSEVFSPGEEELFGIDKNYKINNTGAATFKLNKKAKTVSIQVKKGVRWSDGQQVTAKDIEYSYEILANAKTRSTRYTDALTDIVGLKEYHDGKSNTISGIQMPNGASGRKVVIHYHEMQPGMLQIGSGPIWPHAAPYHYLKNIDFDKLVSSDKVRKQPLFFGPYKVKKVVRGESVVWEKNKYYWRGDPNFNHVSMNVIGLTSVSQAIKSKKFDIIGVVNSQWENVKNTKGVNFIGNIPLSYDYLGFRVGSWDAKKGINIQNKHSKMNNPNLRKAMAYAMNIDQVDKRFYHGLTFRIKTVVPTSYGKISDSSIPGYPYNPAKANQLLDQAGYKRKHGEKYRRTPNGKKLVIHLAVRQSSSLSQSVWENYLQQWHKIGLNVKFVGNRPMEFNNWVDAMKSADPKVDVFEGGWSLSSEPSQADFYMPTSALNFPRFNSKENTKLLKDIDSTKAFNPEYRINAFHKWQEWMHNNAYIVPTTNSYNIVAVNDRITGWSLKPTANSWYEAGLVKK